MKNAPITIKDIAKTLGISPSTVSRALKDHYSIGQETKQKVRELADKLDYRPNEHALGLLGKRSQQWGVLLPDLSAPFYATVMSAIEEAAFELDVQLTVGQTLNDPEREKALLARWGRHISGLITFPVHPESASVFSKTLPRNTPIVSLKSPLDGLDQVRLNEQLDAFTLTKHLILQGARTVAMIGQKGNCAAKKGYWEALHRYRLPLHEELTVSCLCTQSSVRQSIRYLFGQPIKPQAIMSIDAQIGFWVWEELREMGLGNTVQLAVLYASECNGLTGKPVATMLPPAAQMGETAVKMLHEKISKNCQTPHLTCLESRLVYPLHGNKAAAFL